MTIYVVDRGEKVLFFQGILTRETAKQIRAWVKWYFGWKRIRSQREGNELYLFDAKRINQLRSTFFREKVMNA